MGSDKHWNCFKGNVGETSERLGGAHMGFSDHIDTILSWIEFNVTVESYGALTDADTYDYQLLLIANGAASTEHWRWTKVHPCYSASFFSPLLFRVSYYPARRHKKNTAICSHYRTGCTQLLSVWSFTLRLKSGFLFFEVLSGRALWYSFAYFTFLFSCTSPGYSVFKA